MSIYVKDAAGNRTKIAGIGLPGPAGKSAYQYAVEGGFSGTEEEFRALMGVHSNHNLLDNADFRKPINQRGQAEYTGNTYTIDRWVAVGAKIEIKSEGIVFTHTAGNYGDFKQYLENANLLMGKQCTISALIGGNLFSKTFQMGTIGALAQSDFAENLHFFSIESAPCIFRLYSNNSVKIQAVKLERGPVQTLAHKESDTWVLNDPLPNPTLELAKCQRYARSVTLRSAVVENAPMYGWPENKGRLCVNLSPPMRIVPTLISISGRAYKSNTSIEFATESAELYSGSSMDQVVLLMNDPEILAVNAQLFLSSDL